MNEYALGLSVALQVEANVISHHEEAVQAWREGRLPTAEPPASPLFVVQGSGQ